MIMKALQTQPAKSSVIVRALLSPLLGGIDVPVDAVLSLLALTLLQEVLAGRYLVLY